MVFEGESGFKAKTPTECLRGGRWETAFNRSDKELYFANGSMVAGFACVEEADRLRGPQCHALIFDEAAAADRPAGNLEAAWKVASLGCRLPMPDGSPSRKLIATTPRPIPFLRRLEKQAGTIVVEGSSYENRANVSEAAMRAVLILDGTLYGQQEIYGKYIDEANDATIIKRSWIRLFPTRNTDGTLRKLPSFHFILMSLDTAQSEEDFDAKKQETDPSGCVVLGVFNTHDALSDMERLRMKVRGRYAALLLDCWAERLAEPALLDKVRDQNRMKWGPMPGKRADVVVIENKSSGPGIRQWLAKWGVPCWPYNPGQRSKTTRLHGVSPIIYQGGLFVPESDREERKGQPRSWAEPYIEQVCAFAGPGSVEHDEYVDCTSQGVEYLRDRNMLEAKPVVEFLDREEKIEREREEAQQLLRQQESREYVNPYGI